MSKELSEKDYNEIVEHLDGVGRDLSYLHGLATAMCTMKQSPATEDWMELISLTSESGWGFKNKDEENHVTELLSSFIASVAKEMKETNFALPFFDPNVPMSDEDKEMVISLSSDWCRGYLEGVSLDEQWAELISNNEEIVMLVSPCMFLSGILGDEDLEGMDNVLDEDEEEEDFADNLEEEDLDEDIDSEEMDEILEDINVQIELVKVLPNMALTFYNGLEEMKKEAGNVS